MAYESRAYDNEHGNPVVVLVTTGTHDVSRLIGLLHGSCILLEQLMVGDTILRQVKRHNGGRAAVALLKAHGGPDFTEDLTKPGSDQVEVFREQIAAGLEQIAARYDTQVWPQDSEHPEARAAAAMRHAYRTAAKFVRSGALDAVETGETTTPPAHARDRATPTAEGADQ